jgi:hypothetical protein
MKPQKESYLQTFLHPALQLPWNCKHLAGNAFMSEISPQAEHFFLGLSEKNVW